MIDPAALLLDLEIGLQRLDQLGGCHAVEVLHYAVVVDDAQLTGREGDRQEVAVLLFAGVVRILLAALLPHAGGGSRAVVSVGDVERRDAGEDLRQPVVERLVANHPHVVAEAVGSREVVVGGVLLHHLLDDGVDLLVVGIGEEDRLDVGLLVAHVDHAILLLVGTGQLVLLDGSRKVVLEVAAHGQTILRAALHRLSIDIIVLLLVLLQPPFFAPQAEILHRLLVDLLRVFVGDRV